MEDDDGNIIEKQVIGMSKIEVGKAATRLQKHAPASLKLDQIKVAVAGTSPLGAEAASLIPLLTPLALSPNPFSETEEFVSPTHDKKAATPTTVFVWKEPAGAEYVAEHVLLSVTHNDVLFCIFVHHIARFVFSDLHVDLPVLFINYSVFD